jgi:hypothetical protein
MIGCQVIQRKVNKLFNTGFLIIANCLGFHKSVVTQIFNLPWPDHLCPAAARLTHDEFQLTDYDLW